jgi:NADPH:quinone reductase-like Zn-dependent oxidoreductase
MSSTPGTMKAIIFEKFGPASNLKLIQDYPIPKRGPKDIKVKILATSVNPVDYKTRSGILAFATALPKVRCWQRLHGRVCGGR